MEHIIIAKVVAAFTNEDGDINNSNTEVECGPDVHGQRSSSKCMGLNIEVLKEDNWTSVAPRKAAMRHQHKLVRHFIPSQE